jgi:outer membrane protein assembly factor BamB
MHDSRALTRASRRLFLLFVLPFLLPSGIDAATAADALGFRGPDSDGAFSGTVPARRPRVAWTLQTAGPINSSPIWAEGLVIVGSGDGFLHAADGRTGAERWRFKTGGGVDGPAAYADGRVFFESRDRNLYAVDARSGREAWRLALGAELPHKWGWDYYLSGPAVSGPRVYAGSGAGEVLAVDRATGRVAWRFATGGRVRSSPVVAEGVVYVGSFDGFLYALDAASGALRWKFATQGASIDSDQAGFDRRSIQSSPAVTRDLVVFGCRDGHLYGVDRATGKERWNFDHQTSWVVGSPAIARDRTVVGSSDGRFVQAVELATGKELWRSRTDSNALSSPAVAGGVVVIGDDSGAVLAFDVATGREAWRFRAGDTIHSSPLVRDGRIYVGSDDGMLYALAEDPKAGPPPAALRAVYFDARVPYRSFEGDRELRDFLTDASYRWVTRRDVEGLLEARIADRLPSVVVFATDSVPAALIEEKDGRPCLVRRYLDAGGKVVWLSPIPFLYTFDPASNQMGPVKSEDLDRGKRLFGIATDNPFEGECRAESTELGKRWGLPAGWWTSQGPVSPQLGVEALATDEHGHAATWVKRFGGPDGTGLVVHWGRARRLPDPRVVQALAEHGLP